MKKLIPFFILLGVGFAVWFVIFRKSDKAPRPAKDAPLAVSVYGPAFNASITEALKQYYVLAESLVTWDSAKVNDHTLVLRNTLKDIKWDEIQKDTLIYQTAVSYKEGLDNDLEGILGQPALSAKRQSFHSFSQNFYDLLRTVKFNGGRVFLQECPMAFNDTEPGIWLSSNAEIRNPYLGTSHPKYKSGMLQCGETKDSIVSESK